MIEVSRTKVTQIMALVLLLFSSSLGYASCNIVFTENGHDLVATTSPYIISPANQTYNSGLLNLNVSFKGLIWGNIYFSMNYSLDGKDNQTIPLTSHYFGSFLQGDPDKNYWDGSVELPVLPSGSHCLTVYLEAIWETFDSSGSHNQTKIDSQTVDFAVSPLTQLPTPQQPTNSSSTPQPHISISPNPLAVIPTPTETAPNNEPTGLVLYQRTLTTVASMIIIIAVVSVTLACFKRKNKKEGKFSKLVMLLVIEKPCLSQKSRFNKKHLSTQYPTRVWWI